MERILSTQSDVIWPKRPVAAHTATPNRIVSRDEHTGRVGYKRVTQLNRGTAVQVCKVVIRPHARGRTGRHRVGEAGASREGGDEPPLASQEILSTRDHPYYSVSRRTWIDADRLKPGELLRADDGSLLEVVEVKWWAEKAKTYNFEVEDWHSYFVSGAKDKPSVWVHNGPDEIALGLDPHYKRLAGETGAHGWRNWPGTVLNQSWGTTPSYGSKNFGRALHQAVKNAKHIHFDITGLGDLAKAAKAGRAGFQKPNFFNPSGNFTNAELQHVLSSDRAMAKTTFYERGRGGGLRKIDPADPRLRSARSAARGCR